MGREERWLGDRVVIICLQKWWNQNPNLSEFPQDVNSKIPLKHLVTGRHLEMLKLVLVQTGNKIHLYVYKQQNTLLLAPAQLACCCMGGELVCSVGDLEMPYCGYGRVDAWINWEVLDYGHHLALSGAVKCCWKLCPSALASGGPDGEAEH